MLGKINCVLLGEKRNVSVEFRHKWRKELVHLCLPGKKWSSNANLAVHKQGVESVEQVARLCQSETEEVRNTARETTLSFGKSLYNLKMHILKTRCEMVQSRSRPEAQPGRAEDSGGVP